MSPKQLTQQEIKDISLEILKYVDLICRENDITYFLTAGTLLGAVRHKGYIPWDDDIDIMLPRKDYDKLFREFPTDGSYKFLTANNTKHFPFAYGKIIDTRTVKIEGIRAKYGTLGVDIDVFPIDNYPDDYHEAETWCNSIIRLNKRLYKRLSLFSHGGTLVNTIIQSLLVLFYRFLDNSGICSVKQLVKKIDVLSKKYNFVNTNYAGFTAIGAYGVKKRNRKEVFQASIPLEFEGCVFSAPIGYDEFLTNLYGDYMSLPPVEKRKPHHRVKAYWK